ncbi:MAG: 2Fe-2S iron-sulfur cluster-binding protein, partial [Myxococcota bacterium]
MSKVTMNVNGRAVSAEIAATALLTEFIREELGLTGTHIGCDTSQCGACVVHVNGRSVKGCTMLAVEAEGAEVTTIEGLAQNGELHPLQASFRQ